MAKIKPRVKVPKTAAVGEVITIKTLISHPMESGQRRDRETGDIIPRKIINKFVARFNGEEIMSVDMEPALSANPYFEFEMAVPAAGTFQFEWTDDDGSVYEAEKQIEIA